MFVTNLVVPIASEGKALGVVDSYVSMDSIHPIIAQIARFKVRESAASSGLLPALRKKSRS